MSTTNSSQNNLFTFYSLIILYFFKLFFTFFRIYCPYSDTSRYPLRLSSISERGSGERERGGVDRERGGERDGSRDRSGLSFSSLNSSNFNSNNTGNAQSSTYAGLFGSFAGGSSGFGFGEIGSFGSFNRFGGDTIKTDYDQEKLLQQLLHSESLQLRITKGAAPSINQLSPWLWPDKTVCPKIPIWPKELREFKLKNKEDDRSVEKFPDFIPSIDEMRDISGSRFVRTSLNDIFSFSYFVFIFFQFVSFNFLFYFILFYLFSFLRLWVKT